MDLLTFIVCLAVGAPIAKAVATRISGRPVDGEGKLREALETTEQRLEEVEHHLAEAHDRLAEMDERLDFTERVLTQQKAKEQLGP